MLQRSFFLATATFALGTGVAARSQEVAVPSVPALQTFGKLPDDRQPRPPFVCAQHNHPSPPA